MSPEYKHEHIVYISTPLYNSKITGFSSMSHRHCNAQSTHGPTKVYKPQRHNIWPNYDSFEARLS